MRRPAAVLLVLVTLTAVAAAVLIANRPVSDRAASTTAGPATTAADPSTTEASAGGGTLPPGTTVCDRYGEVTAAATIAAPDLVEASGMAFARLTRGVIWAHNDSRDAPRLYANGPAGEDLGHIDLAGALAFDWEDMAAAPDPVTGLPHLYVGDIGDNFGVREGETTVYRIPEPEVGSGTAAAETLRLRYPEGEPLNAETLVVDPIDGSLYIVTRNPEVSRVYRADGRAPDGTSQDLELALSLPLGFAVTGGDISWDGSVVALRGEREVVLWHRATDQSLTETLASPSCRAPSPVERQGEAIAFDSDGSYATVSEGEHPTLFVVPALAPSEGDG